MIKSLEQKLSVLNPWFDDLTYDWTKLLTLGTKVTYKKNEIIFRQNEYAEMIYIVLKGRVRLFLLSADGEEKAISIVGKNGIIGECSLNEDKLYSTNAITNSEVEVVAVQRNVFSDKINKNPLYSEQLLDLMSKKYRLLCMHALQISYIKSLPRICETFVHLTVKYGEKLNDNEIKLTISFTHQEMADLLGVTRVTVAKNIKWLQENNYIEKVGRYYVIRDIDELADVANSELLLD